MHRVATLAGLSLLLMTGTVTAGQVDGALAEVLAAKTPDEVVSTLVFLSAQSDHVAITRAMDANRASLRVRHESVVRSLRETANATQPDLLRHLEQRRAAGAVASFRPFWVANAVRVDATPDEIRAIAGHPAVDRVYYNHEIELVAPVEAPGAAAGGGDGGGPLTGVVEPGVAAVRAPEVWDLGITGAGVLVANVDTGVDGNHPALAGRWAGTDPAYAGHPEWAWFDPHLGIDTFPYDDVGHGTHTMGTICGGAPGDEIGVAPGARWIAAGAIDRPGAGVHGTVAHAISSFEWMVDPDGDPATNWDVPAVCGNSWGVTTGHGYPECDELFWSFLDAVEAAGTVIVFAAGNEGADGLRRPSDRATDEYRTLAVAAVDAAVSGWPVAGFSSRGPTTCTPDGSAAVKPDIAAPGVNVRSAFPGGGYGGADGTSMATPHVTGVIALMRQANPDLSVEQIKQIIYDTAFDLGGTGEDNEYGHGMIDAYAAVQQATVGITFTFPDGRPDLLDPAGDDAIRVVVSAQPATPVTGSGRLYFSTGGPYTELPMVEIEPNTYDAVFPVLPCGATVSYYFSAEAETGETGYSPLSAPTSTYSATAYSDVAVAYDDDFETDTGWTVEDVDIETGTWERGVPAGGGDRGDPDADADGSGQCYLTDNRDDEDLDGGPTRLISPRLDASGIPDAQVGYSRWFTNDDQDLDRLHVQISDDDGATWQLLEAVTDSVGWQEVSFTISDFVTPNDQVRLRFSATDNPNDSITEAAIDAVRVFALVCDDPSCPADLDGDGAVAFTDLLLVLAAWGPCAGCPEDLDGDDVVDFRDLLEVLAAFGECG
jgi:bacillopeptidase F